MSQSASERPPACPAAAAASLSLARPLPASERYARKRLESNANTHAHAHAHAQWSGRPKLAACPARRLLPLFGCCGRRRRRRRSRSGRPPCSGRRARCTSAALALALAVAGPLGWPAGNKEQGRGLPQAAAPATKSRPSPAGSAGQPGREMAGLARPHSAADWKRKIMSRVRVPFRDKVARSERAPGQSGGRQGCEPSALRAAHKAPTLSPPPPSSSWTAPSTRKSDATLATPQASAPMSQFRQRAPTELLSGAPLGRSRFGPPAQAACRPGLGRANLLSRARRAAGEQQFVLLAPAKPAANLGLGLAVALRSSSDAKGQHTSGHLFASSARFRPFEWPAKLGPADVSSARLRNTSRQPPAERTRASAAGVVGEPAQASPSQGSLGWRHLAARPGGPLVRASCGAQSRRPLRTSQFTCSSADASETNCCRHCLAAAPRPPPVRPSRQPERAFGALICATCTALAASHSNEQPADNNEPSRGGGDDKAERGERR